MASTSTGPGSIPDRKATMYMYLVERFRRRTQATQATTDLREFLKGSVVVKGGGTALYDMFVNDTGNQKQEEIKKVLAMDPGKD